MNSNWLLGSVKDASGRFINSFSTHPFPPPISSLLKWESRRPKWPSKEQISESFPVVKPDWKDISGRDAPSLTWIGHATCYAVMSGGIRILTDPVFFSRASPVQWSGPKRYVPPACTIEEIPAPDLVLISHDHYDHLDYDSIAQLEAISDPKHVYAVGLGVKEWFTSNFDISSDRVLEFDWWQSEKVMIRGIQVSVEFVPAQHWGSRSHFDRLSRLWGGFIVTDASDKKFFFAGDTGYSKELFTEIGRRHGPIDISAIPIGAYSPRWFMQPQHVDPAEAFQIHKLVESKLSVGIHWGTFILTDEPLTEPKELLEAESQSDPDASPFVTLKHGETVFSQ